MDKRHIEHVNNQTVAETSLGNEGNSKRVAEKSREIMHNQAERGFQRRLRNGEMIPERRQFI